MTIYATHRFSVGQRVSRLGEPSTVWEVLALVDGQNGPHYRIKSDRQAERVVGERDLTYVLDTRAGEKARLTVH